MARIITVIILICLMSLTAYGTWGDWGDYELPVGDFWLSADGTYVVWTNDDGVTYTVAVRASDVMDETYTGKWPINSGDPNSVLMTPGDVNSQWVWATIDSNLVDVNESDPNIVIIGLPTLTPGSRIFVDVNGFPLFEDNDNAYFDDINDFAGFALGHIASETRPNNYIQVYYLLNFDPNLLNVSVGWARDDVLVGPNNVRIGEGAGGLLREGFQNALGGKGSGEGLTDEADNAFWGYQAGKNVKTPAVREEAYVAANNTSVLWWDEDWNLLDEEFLGGGNVCSSVDVDLTGIVVAGFAKAGAQAYCIRRWDLDLNADDTFFVPDSGWGPAGTWVGDLQFSADGVYLYAVGLRSNQLQGTAWKFNASTGAMIWERYEVGPKFVGKDALDVDEANGYFYGGGQAGGNGVHRRNASDGTWVSTTDFVLIADIIYDSEDDRIYGCGLNETSQMRGMLWEASPTHFDRGNSVIWNILKLDEMIYGVGDREDSLSVFKLNESMILQESYDTGTHCLGVVEDWDGNIAVFSTKITILDTDLNFIADHAIGTTVTPTFGNEIKRIPHQSEERALGSRNTSIGSQALAGASAGAEPNEASAGGYKSMFNASSGDLSTAWGAWSLYSITTGDQDVALGPYSGYHLTTEDDVFVIDSRKRTNAADEIVSSILYGHMANDANDQWLNINADVNMPSLILTDLTATRLVASDANKKLSSVTDLTSWIAGTVNRVLVADDADGTVTLSTPQDTHAGATPTFVGINISGSQDFLLMETGDYVLTEAGGRIVLGTFENSGAILWLGADGLISYNSTFAWDNAASTLTIDGQILGLRTNITTQTNTDYTALSTDDVILVSTGATTRTISFAAASTLTGKIYHIKKIDVGAGVVTLDPNGAETVDGDTTPDITAQYESFMIVSDGSNWHVI